MIDAGKKKKTPVSGKEKISIFCDYTGKNVKTDLSQLLGSEQFEIHCQEGHNLKFQDLVAKIREAEKADSLGNVVIFMGGANNLEENFHELAENINFSFLNELGSRKLAIVTSIPKQDPRNDYNIQFVNKAIESSLQKCQNIRHLPLNSFGYEDWKTGKPPNGNMLSSTGCYKLANLLKNCIDLYYGKSVGCVMAENNVVNSKGINDKEVREFKRLAVHGKVNGLEAVIQFDTGADVCVTTVDYVRAEDIDTDDRKLLRNADGSKLEVIGSAIVKIDLGNGIHLTTRMQIINCNRKKVLLSYPFIVEHGLQNLLPEEVTETIVKGRKNLSPDYSAWPKRKREIYVEQASCEGLELNFIESLDNPHEEEFSIFRGFAESRKKTNDYVINEVTRALGDAYECFQNNDALHELDSGQDAESSKLGQTPDQINTETSLNAKRIENLGIHINPKLSPEQRREMETVVLDFEDMFLTKEENFVGGLARVEPTEYIFLDKDPVYVPMRRFHSADRQFIADETRNMKKWRVIEDSRSAYSSPVVIARNHGKPRLCNDFSILNDRIKTERYPLPRISQILETVRSKKYFCKVDFFRAFWQQGLKEGLSREATGFSTPDGHYQYTVLSFGVKNHPGIFQRNMDRTLAELRFKSVSGYIDDVIIYGDTWDELLRNVRTVLQRLKEANYIFSPKKCFFGYEEISIFGFEKGPDGIKNEKKRIEAIISLPPIRTKKQCQGLLGMLNFIRAFIPNLATLTRPLVDACKEKYFKWTFECAQKFEEIKKILISEPVLVSFDESKELFMVTDACIRGIGGALLQKNENGHFQVISYTSRLLSPSERGWGSTDIELKAVTECLKAFHEYCYQHPVTVISDNIALKFYSKVRNASLRLNKLALEIAQYDIKVQFIKGRMNTLADFLSRNIKGMDEPGTPKDEEEEEICEILSETDIFEKLRTEQRKDIFCAELIRALDNDQSVPTKIQRASRQYQLRDGILMKKSFRNKMENWLTVVPYSLIPSVLHEYHDNSGHFGRVKLVMRLQEKYYFEGMDKLCSMYIQQCEECQRNKSSSGKKIGAMKPLPVPEKPLEILILDSSGKYCRSATNKYHIVSIVDQFSKYMFSMPVFAADAKNIADVIFRFICNFTIPKEIRTDLGPGMRSNIVKELSQKLKFEIKFSVAHNHQSNGGVERSFRTLIQMINCYTKGSNPRNWCELIAPLCLAYNSATHVSLGVSPLEALTGVRSRLNLDLELLPEETNRMTVQDRLRFMEEARELMKNSLEEAQRRNAQDFGRRHRVVEYATGNAVLIRDPNRRVGVNEKMRKKFEKTGVIVGKVNEHGLYEVETNGRREKFHITRLRRYYQPGEADAEIWLIEIDLL